MDTTQDTDNDIAVDMEIPFILAKNLGDIQEPGWILNGILPVGAKCSIYAAPGVGKSFLALDWCMSISAGMEWQGHPTTKGATLYIAGEGMSGMPKRVEAWMAGGDCVDVPRVIFHPRPLNLMDVQAISAFCDAIDDYFGLIGPVLIVIDTLATAMDGQDENDASLMTQAMNGVEMLIERTGATVVLIHHANKGGTYRGSSAYHGALDVMMELKGEADDLTLICKKTRDSMPFENIHLRLIPVEGSAVLAPGSAEKHAITPGVLEVAEILSDLSQEGTKRTWMRVCIAEMKIAERTFYRRFDALEAHGYIMEVGNRWALTIKAQEKLGLITTSAMAEKSPAMAENGGSDVPF